jgi:hypothetical protein
VDVANGTVDWSRRFTGKDRYATPTAIVVSATGASVLDRLGLPQGELQMAGSARVTAASSLRAGDQFTVAVNGGAAAKVTIDDKDTLDTLATKIARASGFRVRVDVVTTEGVRRLQIKPVNPRATVEIGAGKADYDALGALGIAPGLLRQTMVNDAGKVVPADGGTNIYGLALEPGLNLSNADQMKHAAAVVAAAMGVIRTAYKDLVAAATPASAQARPITGTAPAYLTNQIANYQAALNRLTGGG